MIGTITDPNGKPIIDRSIWKPYRKQAIFIGLPFSIKEAFFGGGAGCAKTETLVMYSLCHKWHENPLFKQVLLRRTYGELKNEVVQRTQDVYPRFGAKFNKSDMIWRFPRLDQFGSGAQPNGALIKLGHCEDENDVHQYDSMEISLFSPDELTSLTEYIYLYISQERNRVPLGSGLIALTRAGGMPGGVGHKFTRKRFVEPYGTTYKEPNFKPSRIIGKAGVQRIYIHATLMDNPYIDPNYKQALLSRPEAEKRAKLYGDWDSYEGQVFDEFRDRNYPDEPSNAIHVIRPFKIPDWWLKFIVGDWGFAAMCYVGFYAISPDKRLYHYRELGFLKTRIKEWGPIVKTFSDREFPRLIRFCKSVGQDRGQEETIQQQISEAIGVPIQLSNNAPGTRVAGKMLLHEYLRWKPLPVAPVDTQLVYNDEYARSLLRNKGLIEYNRYLAKFKPEEVEQNLPKLQIFLCEDGSNNHEGHPNCCPLVIEAIKAASYDKSKDDKPAEDVREFNGDDPYDTERYAVDTCESLLVEAESDFIKVRKQQALIEQLNSTGDFTAFYRNMRTAENELEIKPVSRYHHSR